MLTLKTEPVLVSVARERITKRQLPNNLPAKMWAGPGVGQPCAVCDKPIQADEFEYECSDSIDGEERTYRFHIVCETIWNAECSRQLGREI
jgi:hypothetical protein